MLVPQIDRQVPRRQAQGKTVAEGQHHAGGVPMITDRRRWKLCARFRRHHRDAMLDAARTSSASALRILLHLRRSHTNSTGRCTTAQDGLFGRGSSRQRVVVALGEVDMAIGGDQAFDPHAVVVCGIYA